MELDLFEATPLFLRDAIVRPDYTLWRIDGGDERWYYCPEADSYDASVTSIIGSTTPAGHGLIEWFKKHGKDADRVRDERAAYGTFMHTAIEQYLIYGKLDLGMVAHQARVEAAVVPLADPDSWAYDIKKDLLSLIQFLRDRNVKVLGVEVMLRHPEEGYAGAIDLVCEMDVDEMGVYASGAKKGQPRKTGKMRRATAIVDFKSGRKDFYDSHEIQLGMYRAMWNRNFPSVLAEKAFNLSPKDWRKAPTYNLKDQTDAVSWQKIPYLLGQFRVGRRPPGARLVIGGTVTAETDLTANYAFEDIKSQIEKKKQ